MIEVNSTKTQKLQKNLDANEKWFLRKPWIPSDDPTIQAQLYFMKLSFKIKIANLASAIRNSASNQEQLYKACLDEYEKISLFFKNTSDQHRKATRDKSRKNISDSNDNSPTPPFNPLIDSYLASIENSLPFSPIRSRYNRDYDRLEFPKAAPKTHITLKIPPEFFLFDNNQENLLDLLPPDAPRNNDRSLFKTS